MISFRNIVLFMLLCVIWGTTWLGIKAGVAAVPPLLFSGSRFVAAGTILLSISMFREGFPRIVGADLPRLVACSVLMITLCYGALFWGMVHVNSGTAAVLEMSLTPVALMGFALLLREESFDHRRLGALTLGIIGLIFLFGPTVYQSWSSTDLNSDGLHFVGVAAVASAAVTYGWGSVIARPLLRSYSSILVAGSTTLIGGLLLFGTSIAFEPGSAGAMAGRWGAAAWTGWAFLVLFGSLLGYTIYMRLLLEIGATRAGMYCFVSPIIAVVLGVAVYGEQIRLLEVLGMLGMLVAAGIAVSGDKSAKMHPKLQRGLGQHRSN